MKKIICATILFGALVGCTADSKPEPNALQIKAPDSKTTMSFEDQNAGIRFNYPAGWNKSANGTTLLIAKDPKTSASLSLDYPKLPWHPPGMIPLGKVAEGYIDDAKKGRVKEAKVESQTDASVAGVAAKRIKITGKDNGKPSVDEAVVVVHNDHVYILSIDCDAAGYDAAKQALDTAAGSVQWTK